jgi:hypothetical protein
VIVKYRDNYQIIRLVLVALRVAALRSAVYLGSLTRKTERCAPPPPNCPSHFCCFSVQKIREKNPSLVKKHEVLQRVFHSSTIQLQVALWNLSVTIPSNLPSPIPPPPPPSPPIPPSRLLVRMIIRYWTSPKKAAFPTYPTQRVDRVFLTIISFNMLEYFSKDLLRQLICCYYPRRSYICLRSTVRFVQFLHRSYFRFQCVLMIAPVANDKVSHHQSLSWLAAPYTFLPKAKTL